MIPILEKPQDPKSATLSNSQLPHHSQIACRGSVEVVCVLRFFGGGVTNVSRVAGLSEKRYRLLKSNGTEPHTFAPNPHRAGGMPGEPEMPKSRAGLRAARRPAACYPRCRSNELSPETPILNSMLVTIDDNIVRYQVRRRLTCRTNMVQITLL